MGLFRDVAKPRAWPPPSDAASIRQTLDYARQRDPVGHNVHTALAAIYLFLLPLLTAPKDIAFALLLGYALLRLPTTWRCYTALLRMPLTWVIGAWLGWTALSLTWSPARTQGADEMMAARVLLTPGLLWPVLDRLPMLIGAALLGVLGQNIAQALQLLDWLNIRPRDGTAGRAGGWIHPIQTGTWCMAAICWNLAAALLTRGRMRYASIVLMLIAAGGLVVSESRGPWLASAFVVPLTLLIIAVRRPESRRAALVFAVLGIVAIGAAWPLVGSTVRARLDETLTHVQQAREDGAYWTSTGLRFGLWKWAGEVFNQHPVAGAGAGSFRLEIEKLDSYQQAVRTAEEHGARFVERIPRDHAHSTYMHTLATLGVIGALILLAMIVILLRQCLNDPPDYPYAPAMLLVLIGWLIGAQFECSQLNGHGFGLLALIAAATMTSRLPASADSPPTTNNQ